MKVYAFTGPELFGRRFMDSLSWIYRGDTNYTAPDGEQLRRTLFENPALTPDNHVKILCSAGAVEKDYGRALLYKAGPDTGYIGFVEFENDYSAFCEMMDYAKQWFKGRGLKKIWGPIDIDTWHRYRFMTKGFLDGTFAFEPYNKPYYPEFFEKYGFTVLSKYYSKRIDGPAEVLKKVEFKAAKLDKNYTVRKFRMNDFEKELDILYRLSTDIFGENFGYTPLNRREFGNLYTKMKPIMEPDSAFFGLTPDGKEAGFIFGYPEVKQILNSKSRIGKAFGFLGIKTGLARPKVFNIKTLGVQKEHRATRLSSALVAAMYRAALKKGYKTINHCLMREGNLSSGFDAGHGIKNKEYCLYEYSL